MNMRMAISVWQLSRRAMALQPIFPARTASSSSGTLRKMRSRRRRCGWRVRASAAACRSSRATGGQHPRQILHSGSIGMRAHAAPQSGLTGRSAAQRSCA